MWCFKTLISPGVLPLVQPHITGATLPGLYLPIFQAHPNPKSPGRSRSLSHAGPVLRETSGERELEGLALYQRSALAGAHKLTQSGSVLLPGITSFWKNALSWVPQQYYNSYYLKMWMPVNERCFKKQQVAVWPLLMRNLAMFRYSSSGMVKDMQIGNQHLLSPCYKA